MNSRDIKWNRDSVEFFAHLWYPDNKPKAVITLVHGFGEHCMRYESYVEFFVKNRIAVLGFDLYGHGKTEGKRGTIKSYASLMDDIDKAVSVSKELYSDVPHFIYGHSMGGNLTLNYLIRKKPELTGAIIGSPWLVLTNSPNALVKSIAGLLKKIAPNLTIDSGLDSNDISTSKGEVEKYKTDPLNHGRISFRLFSEITSTGEWAIENTSQLQLPVLLMHGNADNITSHKASIQAVKNSNGQIEYVEWEGSFHELHNEPNREDVATYVINWIDKQM